MTYLSAIDKIKILFGSLFDFKGVLIFSILMLLFTVLYLLKKISAKRYTITIILSLFLVFLISIWTNIKVLSNTFDNFMTIFFSGIYFPSIYLYISTLVITLIAFLYSTINIKLRRVYIIINKTMFVITNIIFVIIINSVAKNKIDIFSVNSLYTNKNLVALLEISMSIFLIWIASLIIAYVTNSICDRISKKKEKVVETISEKAKEVVNINLNPEKDYVLIENFSNRKNNIFTKDKTINKPIIGRISKHIPKSINLVHDFAPYEINYIEELKEPEEKIVTPFIEIEEPKVEVIPENNIFNDILNGKLPVEYYDDDKEDPVYNISNPQEVYESNYIKLKNLEESSKENSVVSVIDEFVPERDNISVAYETVSEKEDIPDKNDNVVIESPSVEEITANIKSKRAVENLAINTVSLNELVDDDVLEDVKIIDKAREVSDGQIYTIEDYKKIIGMLNSLKKYGIDHNVTIDDAVAISLISNYSLDDCLKFKDILESTLN